MIVPEPRKKLGVGHVAGVTAIGIVGGVVALLLFFWVVGAVFKIVEIAVIVLLIGLAIRYLIGRALR